MFIIVCHFYTHGTITSRIIGQKPSIRTSTAQLPTHLQSYADQIVTVDPEHHFNINPFGCHISQYSTMQVNEGKLLYLVAPWPPNTVNAPSRSAKS